MVGGVSTEMSENVASDYADGLGQVRVRAKRSAQEMRPDRQSRGNNHSRRSEERACSGSHGCQQARPFEFTLHGRILPISKRY
jgi:hypothetical protein